MHRSILIICIYCLYCPMLLVNATSPSDNTSTIEAPKTIESESLKEKLVSTTHSMKINNNNISYTATIGTQPLVNEKGKVNAAFTYIAYTKNEVKNIRDRPVIFCFNGGPGSSSVWLHLGLLGPKHVEMDKEGLVAIKPYHLIENPYSLLDVADLIFIDPISTGYSKAENGEEANQYHGVEKDISSIAEFIRLYVTRNLRWESPIFLAGESYGTARAAGLALELHDKKYLYVDGIILISSLLNYETLRFDSGNDLPYILFLPSYTAAALYHNKLEEKYQKNPEKTLADVQEFAYGKYARALLDGNRISEDDRKTVIDQLSQYTGLSSKYIDKADLRVSAMRFTKELLQSEGKTIGRFDARCAGTSLDACGDSMEYDPSFDNVFGVFTATLNQYIRADLGWKTDVEYKILSDVSPWDYGPAKNRYLDLSPDLREAMIKDEDMGVFVASGYSDLALPFGIADYTFSHLDLPKELQKNIILKNYEGGHMMYLKESSLIKIKSDLALFIKNQINNSRKTKTVE